MLIQRNMNVYTVIMGLYIYIYIYDEMHDVIYYMLYRLTIVV